MPEALILDPAGAEAVVATRAASGTRLSDEVEDGRIVVPALPNVQHQEIQFALCPALHECVVAPGLGHDYTGVNVSDPAAGWENNYRGPDVVVNLSGNRAVNHGTHWEGGPVFLAEINQPRGEAARHFDLYAG